MKEIGDLLKKTRESQGKTLEEISALTKIQLPTLIALESGDFGRLTNKAFIKGFIRQYAKVLSLDADALIASLAGPAAPQADVKPIPVSKLDSNELTNKTNLLWFRTPSQFITVGAVVIILVLITSIYFISMKMMSYSQETVQKETTSPVNEDDSSPEEDSTTEDSKVEDATSAEKPPVAAVTATPAPVTPATPVEIAPPKAVPQQEAEEESEPPKGLTPAAETTQKMVAIEARANVTVEAVWSTGKSETIQLNANNRHVFYYLEKIRITVDDGGSIKITTHEKDFGVPGEKSKPITINFR
jgi:cytoskeleton protein RodZ